MAGNRVEVALADRMEVPAGCFIGGCADESGGHLFEKAEDGTLFRICGAHYEAIMNRLDDLAREGLFDDEM